ncbi:MAG: hypothetical protein WBC91_18680 [Phototrophicaceae bacterium]
MEYLIYQPPAKITYYELEKSLAKLDDTNLRTEINDLISFGECLSVYYSVYSKELKDVIQIHTRWSLETEMIVDILDPKTFEEVPIVLNDVFYVQFRIYRLDILVKIFRQILLCFDGSISYEYEIFNIDTIDKFLDS